MKVARRRGAVRIGLDPVEVTLFVSLVNDFLSLLEGAGDESGPAEPDGPADPVLERLFPAGYADAQAAAEFRALTRSALRDERVERAVASRDELVAGGGQVSLDAQAGTRWIQVLNDLRLALGTRLEITEDDDHVVDPQAPDAQARTIYFWLTWMQDSLVQALMG
jgi:hypothetical protein